MKVKLTLAAILAGVMFFAACENAQKTGADVAIKAAQTAYAAVADQAKQYVPDQTKDCLLYTSPSPRDGLLSRMPSSA